MNAEIEPITTVPTRQCPDCKRYTEPADVYCHECGRVLPLRFQTPAIAGHTSPETAYVVEDYPYGFRLRCQIRYWLEYKKGHGFRFASQTTNPKSPSLKWNKPKYSTYVPVAIMTKNNQGHISYSALNNWPGERTIDAYLSAYGNLLTADGIKACRDLMILEKAQKHITWTVKPAGTHIFNYETGKLELDPLSEGAENANTPRQTQAEVREVWSKAIDMATRS